MAERCRKTVKRKARQLTRIEAIIRSGKRTLHFVNQFLIPKFTWAAAWRSYDDPQGLALKFEKAIFKYHPERSKALRWIMRDAERYHPAYLEDLVTIHTRQWRIYRLRMEEARGDPLPPELTREEWISVAGGSDGSLLTSIPFLPQRESWISCRKARKLLTKPSETASVGGLLLRITEAKGRKKSRAR